jgi:hemolysin-activating ACP:hemolysin acyltransferase
VQRRAAAVRLAVAFADIVGALMRSPSHKHLSLADVERLVVRPLRSGQYRVARAKPPKEGAAAPAAAVLWASVSPEVDKRLSENLSAPIRLRPDEWTSGEILWLVEAVGDPRLAARLLQDLNEKVLKDREVKMRAPGKDGKPAAQTLQRVIAAASGAAATPRKS